MEKINKKDLGIEFQDLPENLVVVTNKDELGYLNKDKVFQGYFEDDLDEGDDVMVYGLDYDDDQKIIRPYNGFSFDEAGVFRRNIIKTFPQIYRKNKELLIIIED